MLLKPVGYKEPNRKGMSTGSASKVTKKTIISTNKLCDDANDDANANANANTALANDKGNDRDNRDNRDNNENNPNRDKVLALFQAGNDLSSIIASTGLKENDITEIINDYSNKQFAKEHEHILMRTQLNEIITTLFKRLRIASVNPRQSIATTAQVLISALERKSKLVGLDKETNTNSPTINEFKTVVNQLIHNGYTEDEFVGKAHSSNDSELVLNSKEASIDEL